MKLLPSDYIVIAAVILLVGAHTTTMFLIKYYEDAAQQIGVAKEIAVQFERNPIAKWFFTIDALRSMYQFILAPGLLMGLYWYIRRRYYNNPDVLQSFAVALLTFFVLDFLHDVSLLLGVLY